MALKLTPYSSALLNKSYFGSEIGRSEARHQRQPAQGDEVARVDDWRNDGQRAVAPVMAQATRIQQQQKIARADVRVRH